MILTTQTFWMPKHGNTDEEYEDAFWPEAMDWTSERSSFRCAVADGATESSFSAVWARLLTQAWCETAESNDFLSKLPGLGEEWRQRIGNAPLPWYAEEKVRTGAFSSLLGFQLYETAQSNDFQARWKAFAIGDTCLFQLRGRQIIARFPLEHSDDFNNRPFLLGSSLFDLDEVEGHLKQEEGSIQVRDIFYLMTDALASCFLRLNDEEQGRLLESTELSSGGMRSQEAFEDFVQTWRTQSDDEGRPYLRNDDVTLISLRIDG